MADGLRAIVLTDADGTLAVEAVGPEAAKLNLALGHVGMSDEQPGTEDTLGKDVENGISNDLAINTDLAGAIGKTPDAAARLAQAYNRFGTLLTLGRQSRAGQCSRQWRQRRHGAWGPCWWHWRRR